jgi:hypothetical protein
VTAELNTWCCGCQQRRAFRREGLTQKNQLRTAMAGKRLCTVATTTIKTWPSAEAEELRLTLQRSMTEKRDWAKGDFVGSSCCSRKALTKYGLWRNRNASDTLMAIVHC